MSLADSQHHQEFMTRKETATYVTQRYFRLSVSTLAKYAMTEKGPSYTRRANGEGEALYRRADVDLWVAAHVRPKASVA